jgi:hypothetical protein
VSVSVFNLVSKLFNVPLLNITMSFVADVNICITKLVRHFSLLHMMNSIDFLKEKILIFNKKKLMTVYLDITVLVNATIGAESSFTKS